MKIAKLLLLLVFTCSMVFGATSHIKEFKAYDKKIETSSDDELLRIHHSLKSIYINSIVNNDIELKKEVLKSLVKSSNALKLNSSQYAQELQTLLKSDTKTTIPSIEHVKSKPKTTPKKVMKKEFKKEVEKKVKKLAESKTLPNLKAISKKEDRLELSFDKKLSTKDLKTFQLKGKKSFREVFDIKANLAYEPHIKTPQALDDLRIAQYDKDTLRVVFERKSILKARVSVNGTKVSIFYDAKKKTKPKTVKVDKGYVQAANLLPSNRIIVIDAGHGGRDGGAVGTKTHLEKDVVLSMAKKLGSILKKRGYKVYYTRTKDKFIKLRDRTKYANQKGADLFLSIHANSSTKKSLHGVETFFLSPARSERSKKVAAVENQSDIGEMDYFSKQTFLNVFNREKIIAANKLALDVQQGMLNRLRSKYGGVRDGGVREAPFWVLVGAQMPAILIETGYISNTKERKRMFNSHYQNLLVKGIADGIDSYILKNDL